MKIFSSTIPLFLLSACAGKSSTAPGEGEATTAELMSGDTIVENAEEVDPDDPSSEDTEICDGIDNDGDGEVDEGLLVFFFWDVDGDGWGASNDVGCEMPPGAVLVSGDCDDEDPSIHPGAEETCNELDDNCDGQTDEGLNQTYYADLDGDGYGNPLDALSNCMAPDGYVDNAEDCDDTASIISPAGLEICNYQDDNCDGVIDEDLQTLAYLDLDGDDFGDSLEPSLHCVVPTDHSITPGDCDDDDDAIHPDGIEVCDGTDNDCDGLIDNNAVSGTLSFWADLDGDGHGYGEPLSSCSAPDGYADSNDDCDDMDASRSPSSPEVCNDRDDNCNGTIDEGALSIFYEDGDSDGYGTTSVWACTQPPGTALVGDDCDDTMADIFPGAIEVCDSIDSNCNGLIDEDPIDGTMWFSDEDRDGYGDPLSGEMRCYPPEGYVLDDTDCGPDQSDVHPMADERCNSIDDDCDGSTDEDPVDAPTWYRDEDGDGYGTLESTANECMVPTGYVADYSDCNDTDASIAPGADEYCNGIDNDCDGMIDDAALDRIPVYPDEDGDGDGAITSVTWMCADDASVGWSATAIDCDDEKDWVFPGAEESCNEIDDDCDGLTDEDAVDKVPVYRDNDLDGYGSGLLATLMCAVDEGWSLVNTDCNDTDSAQHPGADEVCNDEDDNCNDIIDDDAIDRLEQFPDEDEDGFGAITGSVLSCDLISGWSLLGTDCDDTDMEQYPGAVEVCNDEDDNCDGSIDNDAIDRLEVFPDEDGDGFGAITGSELSCELTSGWSFLDTDCDDDDELIHPDMEETCDGYDDNCDGIVDNEADDCPCTQHNYGSNSYWFCDSTKKWNNAKNWCTARNYSLVTVNSSSEQAWLLDMIRGHWSINDAPHWIGLNDRSDECGYSRDGWTWASGEAYEYEAFRSGQPDNWGGEDCVEINRWYWTEADDDWNDLDCDEKQRFICEASP